ncbi:ATP-binding cassette domain-containing protein [archaeon]|nr:MAG: ATP-binding cassette domain-containing protein [archaeon]
MMNSYITFAAPVIVPFTLFIVYVRLGGQLTINKVYTMYALLNVIRLPFSITPMAWASYQESKVAFSRIGKFLLLDEQEEGGQIDVQNQQTDVDVDTERAEGNGSSRQPLIRLDKATFTYNTAYAHLSPTKDEGRQGTAEGDTQGEGDALVASTADSIAAAKEAEKEAGFLLKDISLTIYPSDFVAIVGSVGSGKSSLLSALLGRLIRSGRVLLMCCDCAMCMLCVLPVG